MCYALADNASSVNVLMSSVRAVSSRAFANGWNSSNLFSKYEPNEQISSVKNFGKLRNNYIEAYDHRNIIKSNQINNIISYFRENYPKIPYIVGVTKLDLPDSLAFAAVVTLRVSLRKDNIISKT